MHVISQGDHMENATGETESVEAQVDVVVLAKKHLGANPAACAWQPRPNVGRGTRDEKTAKTLHEHGSSECISAFLGENSWSKTKVQDLLRLHEKLDPTVLHMLRDESVGSRNKARGD